MVLGFFGLPIMLLVRHRQRPEPNHATICDYAVCWRHFGRYMMARIFTPERWRQYSLVMATGFACGVGLIMMFATGVKFLSSAVYQLPY